MPALMPSPVRGAVGSVAAGGGSASSTGKPATKPVEKLLVDTVAPPPLGEYDGETVKKIAAAVAHADKGLVSPNTSSEGSDDLGQYDRDLENIYDEECGGGGDNLDLDEEDLLADDCLDQEEDFCIGDTVRD